MNKIRISGKDYQRLTAHLFPGDDREAVAVALCGRGSHEDDHTLLVQELLLIPHNACYDRRSDLVIWPTELINSLLEKATKYNYGILKIHCHPGGGEFFSDFDNESDYNLFSSIHAWVDDGLPHASCIMLPDKRLFGRFFSADMEATPIEQISVAGSDIISWHYGQEKTFNITLQSRNLQAFGKKTIAMLSKMKIGVVGCSGTGSLVIEQLKRLGIGELVLVDPDYVDGVNLNRIVGSTSEDASGYLPKVDVMKREIQKVGFGTNVITFNIHASNYEVIKELSQCDVLFSCVDGAEGRHILNMVCSHYLIALIDMGVKLDADGSGGITGIYGSVHYIQPGGSSLLSRGQYNIDTLRAESIKRSNKEEFARNQYLANVNESSPAVISVNMQVAATAVNEFLARIHPYRNIPNSEIDAIRIMFSDCTSYPEALPEACAFFAKYMGKGDTEPLLNNPELSRYAKVA